jgi:hypothetical protein
MKVFCREFPKLASIASLAVGLVIFGQDALKAKSSQATPLIAKLNRFTTSGVPAIGPLRSKSLRASGTDPFQH